MEEIAGKYVYGPAFSDAAMTSFRAAMRHRPEVDLRLISERREKERKERGARGEEVEAWEGDFDEACRQRGARSMIAQFSTDLTYL